MRSFVDCIPTATPRDEPRARAALSAMKAGAPSFPRICGTDTHRAVIVVSRRLVRLARWRRRGAAWRLELMKINESVMVHFAYCLHRR